MKFPLEVARAVREVWPKERALGARISANDWMPTAASAPDDAVAYARELERIGFDYVCVSSGALVPHARIPVAPGYQVPFAEKVKKATGIKVQAVGMIAEPRAGARRSSPRARPTWWRWRAPSSTTRAGSGTRPSSFGVELDYPPQYARSRHDLWPGAKIARGGSWSGD